MLKAYLKACRLNEVMTGGLSSYSLTNMVLAHLQEELKVRTAAVYGMHDRRRPGSRALLTCPQASASARRSMTHFPSLKG